MTSSEYASLVTEKRYVLTTSSGARNTNSWLYRCTPRASRGPARDVNNIRIAKGSMYRPWPYRYAAWQDLGAKSSLHNWMKPFGQTWNYGSPGTDFDKNGSWTLCSACLLATSLSPSGKHFRITKRPELPQGTCSQPPGHNNVEDKASPTCLLCTYRPYGSTCTMQSAMSLLWPIFLNS